MADETEKELEARAAEKAAKLPKIPGRVNLKDEAVWNVLVRARDMALLHKRAQYVYIDPVAPQKIWFTPRIDDIPKTAIVAFMCDWNFSAHFDRQEALIAMKDSMFDETIKALEGVEPLSGDDSAYLERLKRARAGTLEKQT